MRAGAEAAFARRFSPSSCAHGEADGVYAARGPRRTARRGDGHAPRSRQAGVRGPAVACRAARPGRGCRSRAPAGGAALEPVRRRRLLDLRRRLLRPVRRNRSRGRQPRRRGPRRCRGVGRAVRVGGQRRIVGDQMSHSVPSSPPSFAHAGSRLLGCCRRDRARSRSARYSAQSSTITGRLDISSRRLGAETLSTVFMGLDTPILRSDARNDRPPTWNRTWRLAAGRPVGRPA